VNSDTTRDVRKLVISAPSNFCHLQHVGYDPVVGFSVLTQKSVDYEAQTSLTTVNNATEQWNNETKLGEGGDS